MATETLVVNPVHLESATNIAINPLIGLRTHDIARLLELPDASFANANDKYGMSIEVEPDPTATEKFLDIRYTKGNNCILRILTQINDGTDQPTSPRRITIETIGNEHQQAARLTYLNFLGGTEDDFVLSKVQIVPQQDMFPFVDGKLGKSRDEKFPEDVFHFPKDPGMYNVDLDPSGMPTSKIVAGDIASEIKPRSGDIIIQAKPGNLFTTKPFFLQLPQHIGVSKDTLASIPAVSGKMQAYAAR